MWSMIYRKTSPWVKNIAKRRGVGNGVKDEWSAYLAVTAAMAALWLNKKKPAGKNCLSKKDVFLKFLI